MISGAQNRLSNSSAASVSSRISGSSRKDDKEYFFGDETLDNKWKSNDCETTSFSSVEDWLHSDSSFGSKKFVNRETLTVRKYTFYIVRYICNMFTYLFLLRSE